MHVSEKKSGKFKSAHEIEHLQKEKAREKEEEKQC